MIVCDCIGEFHRVGEEIEEEVVHVMNGGRAVVVVWLGMCGEGGMRVEGGGIVGLIHGVIVVVIVVVVVVLSILLRSGGVGGMAKGI